MMNSLIEFKCGDILKDEAEALVNTVNCVGAMGRGIALQFKKAFPDNFKNYAKACKNNEVKPGRMFVYQNETLIGSQFIINFPTKRHWREKSYMEDIDLGLKALVNVIKKNKIHSIAIPALGSGLGGLSWVQVKPKIVEALQDIPDLHVVIYEPGAAPSSEDMVRSAVPPKMTSGRAILIELIDKYLKGLLTPYITLLEIHKLMYFMQEMKEPLRLKFKPHLYGPYADNLRHVLREMEGHYILGYADGGDAPNKPIKLKPGAVEAANKLLYSNIKTRARFDLVVDLIDGFESPFGLELLATVHWVMAHEAIYDIDKIIERIHAWSMRKQQFSSRQIEIAVDVLTCKNWLTTHQ